MFRISLITALLSVSPTTSFAEWFIKTNGPDVFGDTKVAAVNISNLSASSR